MKNIERDFVLLLFVHWWRLVVAGVRAACIADMYKVQRILAHEMDASEW